MVITTLIMDIIIRRIGTFNPTARLMTRSRYEERTESFYVTKEILITYACIMKPSTGM